MIAVINAQTTMAAIKSICADRSEKEEKREKRENMESSGGRAFFMT